MGNRSNVRRGVGAAASLTVLGIALAYGGGAAIAQTAPGNDVTTSGSAVPEASDQDVVVVGARASQQSANNRKKNARTATDSIVADDVGSFPDRNVNEAISRIPGVALSRNEFGEGDAISVRGNGPDLTRVELDGIGVQSTTGLAIGAAGGRSADLRELPAELIKSVDVVKGSTADMTEGSLGGTVQIKTRTGLDFNKPYVSLRAGTGQNSLGRDWTPDFNGTFGRKLLNDRVGIILSGNYAKLQNNGHGFETTTSNINDYAHIIDFDQSPNKTYQLNPSTVGTDAADQILANSAYTPRQIVTMAAAAKTKAECYTIFPYVPTGLSNATGTTLAAQRTQRVAEQQSCLNQWNDATPSLLRNFMNTQTDTRYGFDGRLDYRVADNFTVFVKGTIANRSVHDQNRSRNQITLFGQNINGTFVDTVTGTTGRRAVNPNGPAGYYLFDGVNAVANTPTTGTTTPIFGNVLNVIPGSVKVDALHNVTEFTTTNNTVGIDQIENQIDTKTKYAQTGFEYRGDRLDIDGMAGLTLATSSRGDMRTARSYNYGNATVTLQPNGLYNIALPSNYDDTNPANFVQLSPAVCLNGVGVAPNCVATAAVAASATTQAAPAYTVGQLPLTTPGFSVSYSPALGESSERIAKLDFTYRTDDLIPFVDRLKIGGMYRNNKLDRWGGGGYTVASAVGTFGQPGYVAPIVVPTANVRGTLRACQPTATSTVSCNYGYVPNFNPAASRSGVDTLTPQDLQTLFTTTLEPSDSQYFGDLPNRGTLPNAWQGIRTDELFAQLGAAQFMNFDCLKICTGTDGKEYAQPVTRTREQIINAYAMADFEQRLPFGLLFNGNVGIRGVFTKVSGSGLQTLNSIRTTAAFNPANPTAAAGFTTYTFNQNVTLSSTTKDYLPTVNLNLWGFNEQVVFRLYGGKTVARPPITTLIAAGTCTVDQRLQFDTNDDDVYGCSGRVGNPGLKPFTAWSYNASLEWYPNADTVFSVAYGKLDVKIGAPINVTRNYSPYAGSSQVDPQTGQPLADLVFSVPTYDNGPGYKRDIIEFNVKTAFTVLPWILRHTGADSNLSILSSAATSGTRDPNTGELQDPPNQSKYFLNTSVWYDDGTFQIRLTRQQRTSTFTCITPCGSNVVSNNYPGEQYTNVRISSAAPYFGYTPGVARFTDASVFYDAKASWNINRAVQVYVEARNLRREAQTISTGKYEPFADGTPRVMRLLYGGRRIMTGVRVQFR